MWWWLKFFCFFSPHNEPDAIRRKLCSEGLHGHQHLRVDRLGTKKSEPKSKRVESNGDGVKGSQTSELHRRPSWSKRGRITAASCGWRRWGPFGWRWGGPWGSSWPGWWAGLGSPAEGRRGATSTRPGLQEPPGRGTKPNTDTVKCWGRTDPLPLPILEVQYRPIRYWKPVLNWL